MSPRPLLALALAMTTGCAPALDHLVTSRRYADAICRVRSQAEAERVAEAVERSAGARVHAYAVHESELVASLGDRGREVAAQVSFVRLVLARNELPVGGEAWVWVETPDEREVVPLGINHTPSGQARPFLFALTHEPLPQSTTTTSVKDPARELFWGAVTFGLKPLLFGLDRTTHVTTPGEDDFARQGPVATALLTGLNQHGGAVFALPASVAPSASLRVRLSFFTSDEDSESCSLQLHYRSPLDPGGRPLTDSLDERFGPGARPVREPGVERYLERENQAGRWTLGTAPAHTHAP